MRHHPREEDCDDSIDLSTKKWGSLATDVRDSEECITGCRQRFVSAVLAESGRPTTTAPAVETTDDELCEVLRASAGHGAAERSSAFYRLYCCDSVVCGVWYNKSAGIFGQDREDLSVPFRSFLAVPCI